jgi:sodium/potassium-transporting ATPase subunit alpha
MSRIHEAAAEEVYGLMGSRPAGLTADEVATRLRETGPNSLQPASRLRWLQILARHFLNFFSLLLDISAAMCFVADAIHPGQYMSVLGWALLLVSVLNALFAFAQEYRAERAMQELRKYLPPVARARREGREMVVSAEELVPGDVLLLSEGDRISADARLVESRTLLVNNAPLTGESRSLPLTSARARGKLAESPNMAFAGCTVLRGSAVSVVFATGVSTEFGKIAALSQDVKRPTSPLRQGWASH